MFMGIPDITGARRLRGSQDCDFALAQIETRRIRPPASEVIYTLADLRRVSEYTIHPDEPSIVVGNLERHRTLPGEQFVVQNAIGGWKFADVKRWQSRNGNVLLHMV